MNDTPIPTTFLLICIVCAVTVCAVILFDMMRHRYRRLHPILQPLYLRVGNYYLDTDSSIVKIVRQDILQNGRADDYPTEPYLVYIGHNGHYYTERGQILESFPAPPLDITPKDLVTESSH